MLCCSFPHSLWPPVNQQRNPSWTWDRLSGGFWSSYSSPELHEVQPRVIWVCDFFEPWRATVQQGVPRTSITQKGTEQWILMKFLFFLYYQVLDASAAFSYFFPSLSHFYQANRFFFLIPCREKLTVIVFRNTELLHALWHRNDSKSKAQT